MVLLSRLYSVNLSFITYIHVIFTQITVSDITRLTHQWVCNSVMCTILLSTGFDESQAVLYKNPSHFGWFGAHFICAVLENVQILRS